jgi:RNA polymerase sigma factor (sigma-70 family)
MAHLPSQDASSLENLVHAGRDGSQDAFTTLYDRYQLYAWSVALRTTTNRTVAEEAVVDGFAVALGSLHRLREPVKFPSYLASCVRNEVLMSVRRAKPLVQVDSIEDHIADDPTPESAFDASEESQRAYAAFARLDDRQQQVIMLVDIEGRPIPEAATSLGLTTNALYQFLFRARKALRLRYIAPALANDSPQECRDCNDHLAQFANETASARAIALVERHLPTCSECQVRLMEVKETSEILNSARGVIPIAIAASVAAKVARQRPAPRHAPRHLRHLSAVRHAAVLAGAVIVLTGSVASGMLLTHTANTDHTTTKTTSTSPPTARHDPKQAIRAPRTQHKTATATAPTTQPGKAPQATRSPSRTTTPTTSPTATPVGQFTFKPIVLTTSMTATATGYTESLLQGRSISSTVTASDPNYGSPAPSLTESGSLPAGIAFSTAGDGTGRFSGTATSSGTFIATVTATDSDTASVSTHVSIVVNAPPVLTAPSTVVGIVGTTFTFNLGATGYPIPSINASGALPPGLQFVVSGTMVSIQGTPLASATGSYTVTVIATNSVGTARQVISITINS